MFSGAAASNMYIVPMTSRLFLNYSTQLINRILKNKLHVLQPLLPEKTSIKYNLHLERMLLYNKYIDVVQDYYWLQRIRFTCCNV